LFGASPESQDVARWRTQGFNFSVRASTLFGLSQLYGGPCGILAPVQAFIIKHLLFDTQEPCPPSLENETPLAPTAQQATEALLSSLAEVIMRAASGPTYIVVTGSSLEALRIQSLNNEAEVRAALRASLPCLQSGIGVLLFVYSVLLTRGIDITKDDMDDREVPLVGRFGHCCQEAVNLVLTGRAVANVFDGEKELGEGGAGLKLRGIDRPQDIGYLTLLEAMRYSKVGEHFKDPKYPIWVVGSASHYTVLFGRDARITHQSDKVKREKKVKAAFVELDPEENGFVTMDLVPQLLTRLDMGMPPADQLTRALDPDGMGICLWQAFLAFVDVKAPGTGPPTVYWNCGACTFLNPPQTQNCEMCATLCPPPQADLEQNPPQRLELFHFNGIEGHGGAQATVAPVFVNVLDPDFAPPPDHDQGQGLKEVILTRWPSAEVTFGSGVQPKII
jgi:hypothetical protein